MADNAQAAPFITTERLELWQPRAGEYAQLFEIVSDPQTRKYLGSKAPSLSDSYARELRNAGSWALFGYGNFIIRLRGQDAVMGICGVFRSFRGFGKGLDDVPEAGWIIHRNHWGKGYAREAMSAALDWFDRAHGPQRIGCMIEEGHDVSLRLAERLGFAEYDRHEPEDETPDARALILLERLPKT